MRRKRKRFSLRPKPILRLLLVLAIAAGIWFSPITSIRSVRIEGAIPSDQERLERIAKRLEGIPNIRIDPRITESEVLKLPEAQWATLTRSLFGSALLKVKYRTPVAKLLGHPGVALSNQGVFYKAAQIPKELPQIQLPSGGPPTLLTLSSNWQPKTMAKLAQDVLKLRVSDVIRIQVEEGGLVCLNMGSGRVILGSIDNLDEKLSVLRDRLAANPNELNEVEDLVLTSPKSPSFVPRKENRP
ncbi:MAG: cell division protein FtsQ/DivIB [Fimbriimonas sp.]